VRETNARHEPVAFTGGFSIRPVAGTFSHWIRILWTLTIQAALTRVGRNPLGFVLVILEPISLIIVFSLIYAVIERRPVFGPSQTLFHATGVIPFYWFIRLVNRTRNVELDSAARYPVIKPMDAFLAQLGVECVIMALVTFVVFFGMALLDIPDSIPFDLASCAAAVAVLVVFSAGLGLISAVVIDFFPMWAQIMQVLSRGLMILSGVFQVLDFLPVALRDVLAWNPIAQGVIWFRTGVLHHYPAYSLDIDYFMFCALLTFAFGVSLEHGTRKHRGARR
jgi:capsular polysaccharide transport system permease protein